MSNLVEDFGWRSSESANSGNYLAPFVLSWLKSSGARRVLDLGAGNGALCGQMAKAGLDVVGVEYDAGGVRIARETHPNIHFYKFGVQDDPKQLLATEAPFDVVVSTEVVEHLFSPHLLPAYAQAVLKPGGKLLITTPYHGYLKNIAVALTGKYDTHHDPTWHGGHIKFWSRATLTKLLNKQGFDVQEFHGIGRAPYMWMSMALVGVKR